MAITAQDVNKLRKITGAGMMDCKKALQESDGDIEKAIEELRKKGQKVAANRAERDASEGVVLYKINSDKSYGVVLSLNCETDFVAKNSDFQSNAEEIIKIALKSKVETKEQLLDCKTDDGQKVSDLLLDMSGKIGEKIEVQNLETVSSDAGCITGYNHHNSKLSCLVAFNIPADENVFQDVAMQIAAMNPLGVDENSVPVEVLEKERELAIDTLRQEGKPEDKIPMIAEGKNKEVLKRKHPFTSKIFQRRQKRM